MSSRTDISTRAIASLVFRLTSSNFSRLLASSGLMNSSSMIAWMRATGRSPGSPWSFSGTCWWPQMPLKASHCCPEKCCGALSPNDAGWGRKSANVNGAPVCAAHHASQSARWRMVESGSSCTEAARPMTSHWMAWARLVSTPPARFSRVRAPRWIGKCWWMPWVSMVACGHPLVPEEVLGVEGEPSPGVVLDRVDHQLGEPPESGLCRRPRSAGPGSLVDGIRPCQRSFPV